MPYHIHLNGSKMEIRDYIVQLIRPQTEKKRENLGKVPPLLLEPRTHMYDVYKMDNGLKNGAYSFLCKLLSGAGHKPPGTLHTSAIHQCSAAKPGIAAV